MGTLEYKCAVGQGKHKEIENLHGCPGVLVRKGQTWKFTSPGSCPGGGPSVPGSHDRWALSQALSPVSHDPLRLKAFPRLEKFPCSDR